MLFMTHEKVLAKMDWLDSPTLADQNSAKICFRKTGRQGGARALFHGNRSTKPGMASRELVYEAKYVELAGLSNQIITSIRLGSWRPRKKESASGEKREKLFTVSHLGPPN